MIPIKFTPEYEVAENTCFWTDLVKSEEDCSIPVLLKPFQREFIPPVFARAAQAFKRECPAQGGGNSGGSTPTPGQRCTTVIIYGPPSPIDGGPTVIGTTTVCV